MEEQASFTTRPPVSLMHSPRLVVMYGHHDNTAVWKKLCRQYGLDDALMDLLSSYRLIELDYGLARR